MFRKIWSGYRLAKKYRRKRSVRKFEANDSNMFMEIKKVWSPVEQAQLARNHLPVKHAKNLVEACFRSIQIQQKDYWKYQVRLGSASLSCIAQAPFEVIVLSRAAGHSLRCPCQGRCLGVGLSPVVKVVFTPSCGSETPCSGAAGVTSGGLSSSARARKRLFRWWQRGAPWGVQDIELHVGEHFEAGVLPTLWRSRVRELEFEALPGLRMGTEDKDKVRTAKKQVLRGLGGRTQRFTNPLQQKKTRDEYL